MPFKCVVPLCKSNYKPPYVSCFRFPKESDRRNLWISRIRRENFMFTDMITEDKWTDKEGKVHFIPGPQPGLTEDAYPCHISDLTPDLNDYLLKKRKNRDDIEEERLQECLKQVLRRMKEILNNLSCRIYLTVNFM